MRLLMSITVLLALGASLLVIGCGPKEVEGELPTDMANEEYIHHTDKGEDGKAPGEVHKNLLDEGSADK